MRKLVLSWSGGKDAAMALHALASSSEWRVVGLLTTFVPEPCRVAVHNVPRSLVRRQARTLGLPLHEVMIPPGASNAAYEAALRRTTDRLKADGVEALAFGDLFLADIREWRDALAARLGVASVYPLWGEPTDRLAAQVLAAGVAAVVCSVDLARLPARFAGRRYDAGFIAELPAGVDACGERGEFHTFVTDAPGFRRPVATAVGDLRTADGFAWRELTPAAGLVGRGRAR